MNYSSNGYDPHVFEEPQFGYVEEDYSAQEAAEAESLEKCALAENVPLEDANFVIVDVETTGLDSAIDRVVEVAAIKFLRGTRVGTFETLVNPRMHIPPAASAVHHLIDDDVAFCPSWDDVGEKLRRFVGDGIVVAHNAEFDRSFLPELTPCPWVCSMRLARHVWPDAPKYSNQFLRYWLEIRNAALQRTSVHRALADVLVTAHIFFRALEVYSRNHAIGDTPEELMQFSASPITVRTMPFGKHYGMLLSEVPRDYLQWALRTIPDLDRDLHATIMRQLEVPKPSDPIGVTAIQYAAFQRSLQL